MVKSGNVRVDIKAGQRVGAPLAQLEQTLADVLHKGGLNGAQVGIILGTAASVVKGRPATQGRVIPKSINGTDIKLTIHPPTASNDSNWEVYLTVDPVHAKEIFEILVRNDTTEISEELSTLTMPEIQSRMDKLTMSRKQIADKIFKSEQRTDALQTSIHGLQEEMEKLQSEVISLTSTKEALERKLRANADEFGKYQVVKTQLEQQARNRKEAQNLLVQVLGYLNGDKTQVAELLDTLETASK